jgi:hypothetical protein
MHRFGGIYADLDLFFTSIYTIYCIWITPLLIELARNKKLERYKPQLRTRPIVLKKQWLADEEEGYVQPLFNNVCAGLPY